MAEPAREQSTPDIHLVKTDKPEGTLSEPMPITVPTPRASDGIQVQGGINSKEYLETMRQLQNEQGTSEFRSKLEHPDADDARYPLLQEAGGAKQGFSIKSLLRGFSKKRR